MARNGLEALFDDLKAAAAELDRALAAADDAPGAAAGPAGDAGVGSGASPSFAERAAAYARAHPWQVLLGAVAVGYLAGRLGRGRSP